MDRMKAALGIEKKEETLLTQYCELNKQGLDKYITRLKALHLREQETRLTQLIDGNGKINTKGLDTYLSNVKMEKLGLEYEVVSIIGPQSSGKSSLLNHLFGTTFPEMNAMKGRTQTTLGIWIARATDIVPCTLVIDVEGSDTVKQGEDGTLFEKQSALFALAVSDVVLVNMWCKDIGREQGGSRPLMKIVFEKIMNLKTRRKTTLLVVLRDKNQSPLETLEAAVKESIDKIFDSVPKPEAHKNSSPDDFFNVYVTSLPSFEYQEELFREEVKTLRKRFVNSTSLGGLARDKTDKVPCSAFSYSIIWNSIKENKDLDLPAHKIMVDTVRCDQIVQKCYSDFVGYKEWQILEKTVKSGPILGFGAKLSSIINTCLSQYDAKVIHCDENVRIKKRETLLQRLLKCVQPAREVALEHQYHMAVSAFKRTIDIADLSPGKILASVMSCMEYSKSIIAQGCKEIEIEHVKLDASKVSERVERDIHQCVEYVTLKIDIANAAANKALVQQAAMAEMIASANAATAATQAMVAEMKAERTAAEQREKATLLKKKEESGCTIQ